MNKLTNDQLEVLVQKRNEAGLKHAVEVMNNEELAAYKINCEEAIARHERMITKYKVGGKMQKLHAELKEELEGYVAYIESKLNEETKKESPIVTITDMKSKGTKYEITYKGQTVSRTTKREYTHVVIANAYTFGENGKLLELGFCGRHDLAVKRYEEYRKNNVKVSVFYDDIAYRKPENFEAIKNKKLWENLQVVKLVQKA